MIWTEIKLARNPTYFGGNQKMFDQIIKFVIKLQNRF